jgi:uncharacterized protein YndB with AHSA1/START domain
MSVTQADFTLERHYDHAPERLWAAWTDQRVKERWFLIDQSDATTYRLDAREGGTELLTTTLDDGRAISFAAQYVDVVASERLVYLTEMHLDGQRMSATLGVVTLEADGAGTRLTLTEHGAYLDGLDRPDHREQGTGEQLDRLASALAEAPVG